MTLPGAPYAYYNEHDKFAAQWLRELIKKGLVMDGEVDERDIQDVKPDDLVGFTRCHFFAGIAGWDYALQLAGWPINQPVWTGSCPCQPFSVAGQRKGFADKRHLWPDFYRLIQERNPATIFGEQVGSKDGLEWLDRVRTDLENQNYAFGAADLCAASVGSPHIRQRLYWMANSDMPGQWSREQPVHHWMRERDERVENARHEQKRRSSRSGKEESRRALYNASRSGSNTEGMGDSSSSGSQEQWGEYSPSGERCSGLSGFAMQASVPEWNGPTVALECADGYRRASSQPDAFPVAHGVLKRMGKLRGSGNAIIPQVAAQFIRAYIETQVR